MAAEDSETKLKRLIALISSHMELNGLNILRPNWKPSFATAVVAVMLCFQPILSAWSIMHYRDSLEVLTECLSVTCTGVQVVTRNYFYMFQRDLGRSVVQDVSRQRLLFGAAGNARMEQLFSQSVDRMMLFYRLLHTMFLSSTSFILLPLVMPDPKKYNLPLAFQLPFLPPDEQPLYYYINYVYHVVLTLMAIHHLAPMDGIIMVSLMSTCTRIRALKLLLEELDQRLEQSEWQKTEHLEPDLDRIIVRHGAIKRFARQINRSYQMHFFTIFGTICIIICMCLNVIALTPKNSVYPFLVASIFQLFVVCYFGNILLIENDSLAACIGGTRWYRMTVRQQRKVRFLIANAQPDVRVSAVFLPVNMKSFVTILRAAYSYFTLLN